MIIVTNAELNDDVIKSLNMIIEKDISPKIAFELLKITTTLQVIVDSKNKIHNKLLKKYAEEDPDVEGNYRVHGDKIPLFQKDLIELNEIIHEFDLDEIDVNELQLDDKIKVRDLLNLSFLFKLDIPEVRTSGGESI
jgi:hypothetical protein